jgi:hypothetical protein
MSTLRVSNIEAKADASSPTIDEKVKVTSSQGRVLVQIDGKTSGITTVGINTTGNTFTVNANNGVTFAGIVTATGGFSGNLTGNVNSTSGVTTVTTLNVGVGGTIITTTTGGLVGIGTAFPSQKLEVVGGEIKAGRVDTASEGGQISFGRSTDNATGWYIDAYGNTSSPSLRFVDVSNASIRMTIDGSGRITKPLQPYVQLPDTTSYGASGSLISSPATCGILQATATQNIGNNWSNSTYTFTCPVDGIYGINTQASIDNVAAGRYIFVLSINGGYEEIVELNDTYQNDGVYKMRKLSTGDTIRFGMNGVSGSQPSYHMEAQIYLLG